jgi:hypothetical protein
MNREQEILRKLKLFTVDCRHDMHDPINQGIKASVIGDHLDNAMGNHIMTEPNARQEFLVILRNEDNDELHLNLADLIALARLAKFPVLFSNPVYDEIMAKAGFESEGKGIYYVDDVNGSEVNLNDGASANNLRKIVDGAFNKGQRLLKEDFNNLIKL